MKNQVNAEVIEMEAERYVFFCYFLGFFSFDLQILTEFFLWLNLV